MCAQTPRCFKKSAVSEVDPCGGVKKHPTSISYGINEYILSMRSVPVLSRPILDTQDILKLTMINFLAVISE